MRAFISWEELAMFLADCHAATARHEGTLRRTSKHSRERFADICEIAEWNIRRLRLLDGREVMCPEVERLQRNTLILRGE